MKAYICKKRCVSEARFVECETGPHYAKAVCPTCSGFIDWVPHPDKPENKRSSKKLLKQHDRDGIDYCQICLRQRRELRPRDTYHGHHLIEHQHGGTDDPVNILKVCTACHAWIHWTRTYIGNSQVSVSTDLVMPLRPTDVRQVAAEWELQQEQVEVVK